MIERRADAGEQGTCCLPSPRRPAVAGSQDDDPIRIARVEECREAGAMALLGFDDGSPAAQRHLMRNDRWMVPQATASQLLFVA